MNALVMALTLIFAFSAYAKKDNFDFSKRWVSTPPQYMATGQQKQEIQIFRRWVYFKKQLFSVGDIILNTIPKAKGEGYVSPDDMVASFDKALGVKSWSKHHLGTDVYYEGTNRHTGKMFRIYVSQTDKELQYSLANYRIGYRSFLHSETLTIQHALGNKDKKEFKKTTQTLFKKFQTLMLLAEAYAQDEGGDADEGDSDSGDSDGISSLSELSEEDIVRIVNGLIALEKAGPALDSLGKLGAAFENLNPEDLQKVMGGFGKLGDSLGGLADSLSGLSSIGDSSLAKFMGKSPTHATIGVAGSMIAAKAANKILTMAASGIVDGSIQLAKGAVAVLSGQIKRQKDKNAFDNFMTVISEYDKASEAIYAKTRELNDLLEKFQYLIGKGESLESYFSGMGRFQRVGLDYLEEQEAELKWQVKVADGIRDGKPYIPTPDDLAYVTLNTDEIYDLCSDSIERVNIEYREQLKKEMNSLTTRYPEKKYQDEERERLSKRMERGLQKDDLYFDGHWYKEVTSDCDIKIKNAIAKKRKKIVDEAVADMTKRAETCFEESNSSLEAVTSQIKFFKTVKGGMLRDPATVRSVCNHLQDIMFQLFLEEKKLNDFRTDLLKNFEGMTSHAARMNKKTKSYDPDKDDGPLLKNAKKDYNTDKKDLKKKFSETLKKMSKRCGEIPKNKEANCKSLVADLENKLITPHLQKIGEDIYGLDSLELDEEARKKKQSELELYKKELEAKKQEIFNTHQLGANKEYDEFLVMVSNSMDSYTNTLHNRFAIVEQRAIDKATTDIGDHDSGTKEINSKFDLVLNDFMKRVEADRTGLNSLMTGATMPDTGKSVSKSLDELKSLTSKEGQIKQLCGQQMKVK